MVLATWYDWNNVTCTVNGVVYDGSDWAHSACYEVYMATSTDEGVSWQTLPHVFPTVSDPALDGAASGDGGAAADSGVRLSCNGSVYNCPWELPYCCITWPDGWNYCTDDPERYLRDVSEAYDWQCVEKSPEGSTVPFACIDRADYHSELCPESHPHCCRDLDGVEVCSDRLFFGWSCGE